MNIPPPNTPLRSPPRIPPQIPLRSPPHTPMNIPAPQALLMPQSPPRVENRITQRLAMFQTPIEPEIRPLEPERTKEIFTMDMCEKSTIKSLRQCLDQVHVRYTTSMRKDELCQVLANYYKQLLPTTKKMRNIIIDDPIGLEKKGASKTKYLLTVTERMYNLIRNGPITYTKSQGKLCRGVSYVFGPLFDLRDYVESFKILPKSGYIAVIDFDALRPGITLTVNTENLNQTLQTYPEIMWVDRIPIVMSVLVYIHYDVNRDIDSILIDDDCLLSTQH